MSLKLHNTLSGREELFIPLDPPRVSFYSCGPTVYDFAHIGNFRSFLAADLLRRWIESPLCDRVDQSGEVVSEPFAGGYDITHVMNITDVGHMVDDDAADGGGEDKMEAARKRLLEDKKAGKLPADAPTDLNPDDPVDIANFYAEAFIQDARTLGMKVVQEAESRPELLPRPTQVIPQMLEMVMSLVDKGNAYIGADGVAYFDTSTFEPYGTLSGNTRDKLRSGAGGRVNESTQRIKKHPADFMLWKPDPTHLMRWNPSEVLGREVPLKEGYPGWHLECSVMAGVLFGKRIDLHSGGEDNIFPHHECEIAQSCCANGTDIFAKYWFHSRHLRIEGGKMSKSQGNFFTVRDLLGKGFSPAAIRLELIKTHYRSNANFTEQGLKDSRRMVERWRDFVARGEASSVQGERNDAAALAFAAALNDDLNIAGAIGAINTWINDTPDPTRADAQLMSLLDDVLGVLALDAAAPASAPTDSDEDARIDALVQARSDARATKNWAEADRIRDELEALNVVVTDTPDGATWERKATL